MSMRTITNGENSGDVNLDAAAVRLADGLARGNEAAIRSANQQIEARCGRLGI
jgi:hypothetical protein